MTILTLSTDIQHSGNTVPEWIQLLPDEPEFITNDGREFVIINPQEVIQLSTRKKVDMNIDYEHSIHDKSKEVKPAAGWIKELALKDGAIFGRVEWTPKAEQMIANKEYRYLSPVLATIPMIDGQNMITQIVNVTLTNHPALEMNAFCSHKDFNLSKLQDLRDMSQIAELINIESNSPSDILSALKNQQTQQEIHLCSTDVQTAMTNYVFPRCFEDDFLAIRQHLGQTKFQSLTQKLSALGLGNVQILVPQTHALKARGIDLEKNNLNAFGLTDKELQACKQTNVSPEEFANIKSNNNDY